ncbi:MAG: TetR/AcrR family transcriptional regulator [Crocinitomicaceae bacterium]
MIVLLLYLWYYIELMHYLPIQIIINEGLYVKDPESTALGKKIISKSIELIDELGFEAFTFKKLGKAIGSPESSVYRYFESKHQLLVYLICWYWSWIEYKLVFGTVNQQSSLEKLNVAIRILTEPIHIDHSFEHVNEVTLNRIVVAESTKVFHTKKIDKENRLGYFAVYKRIVQRVSEIILEVNPDFKYPNMLVSTVMEGAHQQAFFVEHLPTITDQAECTDQVQEFYTNLVLKVIGKI